MIKPHSHIKLSVPVLKQFFNLRKQRVECLLLILMSLMQAQTNNLKALSNIAKTAVQSESTYKRFIRFIQKNILPPEHVAKLIIYILNINTEKRFIVSMDRTYWMFGKTHLNFLYLAITCNGYAIPLFLTICGPNKKGHSSIEERNRLLRQFHSVFGLDKIEYLLADREFMGHDWIQTLKSQKIPYVIRYKENGIYISNSRGVMKKAKDICRFLEFGKPLYIGFKTVGRSKVYREHMSAFRALNGEIILLGHSADVKDPCAAYRFRWGIELCFRSMKSYGFNMEDTAVTKTDRLGCLMQLISIAFAWSLQMGAKLALVKPIAIKKHGYRAITPVKLGLNAIVKYLSSGAIKFLESARILKFILGRKRKSINTTYLKGSI